MDNKQSFNPEITITIDTREKLFLIDDNGVGMDANIILNYYLNIGASFRDSTTWRDIFIDDEMNAKILRSGRFGIGVLAAYLIGDSIEVTTRHFNEDSGYSFYFSLDGHSANVSRVDAQVGTRIAIRLNENSMQKFSSVTSSAFNWFNWYTLDYPKIKYVHNEKEIPFGGEQFANLNYTGNRWFKLTLPGNVDALWSFRQTEKETDTILASVSCNGIKINGNPENMFAKKPLGTFFFGMIYVSLFDPNAVLPLSLNRNNLEYTQSFDAIMEDVCRFLLAKMFFVDLHWGDGKNIINSQTARQSFAHEGFTIESSLSYIGVSCNGYMPLDRTFLTCNDITTIRCIQINHPVIVGREVIQSEKAHEMAMQDDVLSIIFDESEIRDATNELTMEMSIAGLCYAVEPKYTVPVGTKNQMELYAKYTCQDNLCEDSSAMSKVIHELFDERDTKAYSDDYWIPIDLTDRMRKFPKAYETLKKYMDSENMAHE